MAKKEIICGIGIDVDSVAGQIGSYAGGDSPSDISRGVFASEVGTPRMVRLLDRMGIRASWFIPGHTIETFPKQMKMVADAGHEIGMHGYTHENPIAMTPEQEIAILDKTFTLVEKLYGKPPVGYVAPWWEMSQATPQLLMERGIKYDHSQMHDDFTPYWMRIGEKWTVIDYSKHPKHWMKPMDLGTTFPIVQIPGSWYLDDLPPMMFMKKVPNSGGWTNPRDVEQWWCDQFDWVYREMDYAVFTLTVHPDISGRPQVLLMLERVINYISRHPGVKWCVFDDIAADFAKRSPFKGPKPKLTAKQR
jgi:peptidoglycan/xylan/chitin deacetylase (PgdA/CDA1 family)